MKYTSRYLTKRQAHITCADVCERDKVTAKLLDMGFALDAPTAADIRDGEYTIVYITDNQTFYYSGFIPKGDTTILGTDFINDI